MLDALVARHLACRDMTSRETSSQAPEAWITAREAAALLPGVTVRTLQRWAAAGKVPSATLPSGHRRFLRSDVEQLLTPSRSAS